jgi:hypothetical protein
MVSKISDFFRSIADEAEDFANKIAPQETKTSGGVSDVPDTTSKITVEKNAQKGIVPWLNAWVWGEQAYDLPLIDKIEPLPMQPDLPAPSNAARKLLETLRETNIKTWIAQEEPVESNLHRLFIEIFKLQINHREEAARINANRLRGHGQQLKSNEITQRMLMDEIASSDKVRSYLSTALKVCGAVGVCAFSLTALMFVTGATGGGALPILSWFAANTQTIGVVAAVTQSAAAVGGGISQAGSAYLQDKSEKAEAKVIAAQHQNDLIDLEMKALRQWMIHVFTAISTLYGNMRQVEQKRHESTKTEER